VAAAHCYRDLCEYRAPPLSARFHDILPLLFFFPDTPTPEIYTLSLHDALPISPAHSPKFSSIRQPLRIGKHNRARRCVFQSEARSEEHTSELQSLRHLVCRLLLEKKKHVHFRQPG